MRQVVTFLLDDTQFGVPLAAVERVLRAIWITHLPQAPAVVLGVFDLQGSAVPAVSLRRRFGLAERPVEPGDQLVVAPPRRWTASVAELGIYLDLAQQLLATPVVLLPSAAARGVRHHGCTF